MPWLRSTYQSLSYPGIETAFECDAMGAARLGDALSAHGRVDRREMLKAFLSDHANGNNSICVHSCKENPYHTYVAMINNLTDRVMEVCRGNPCQGEFAIYTFS